MPTNWAGNITYAARSIEVPAGLDALRRLVASASRIRALGTRHSFTTMADSDGILVSLAGFADSIDVDSDARQVSVGGGVTYGALADALQDRGWALANLASLPHISVAGAVSTGTHGSGDENQSLAAAVAQIELMGPDGNLRILRRGDPDFDGSVVGLGALGIVTRVVLDIEPTYEVWQAVYTDVPWASVLDEYDAITEGRYSVSIFTMFSDEEGHRAWVKQRGGRPPQRLCGGERAKKPLHILRGAETDAMTDQTGEPGPWAGRLPHFRMEFTPSRGEELQSEYLLPRGSLREGLTRLWRLGPMMRSVLQTAEIRSVAADDLWLSPAYGADVVGVHFTWLRDPAAVDRVLHEIEDALLPLGARPHWGKVFVCGRVPLAQAYPRLEDFAQLRERVDPDHVFTNAWLDAILPPAS